MLSGVMNARLRLIAGFEFEPSMYTPLQPESARPHEFGYPSQSFLPG